MEVQCVSAALGTLSHASHLVRDVLTEFVHDFMDRLMLRKLMHLLSSLHLKMRQWPLHLMVSHCMEPP